MDWGLARVLGHPDTHDLRLRSTETSLAFVESERRADASHSADSVLFTMDGDVVGTPAYMAPEQARGEIDSLGPRSDVYALGAMLYHLLTGQMPFVAPGARVSQHVVLRWALEGPPRSVHELRPDVPEELVAICEKAMARDPDTRYPDMGALAKDLRAYLENRVVQAHKRGAWIEFRKWIQRNRALAAAWGAAVLVAVLGLGATAWVQVRGRRVAEEAMSLAQANELAAKENLAEAKRQEAIARREHSNVLRLSAVQELEDLRREADSLWPAVPERIPDMQAWLSRARNLIAGLDPDGEGDPGHRGQLAVLHERAVTFPADDRARLLARHPRGAELERTVLEIATLEAAAEVRAGVARPAQVELEESVTEVSALQLNSRALDLVHPERTIFGREPEGLALVLTALARADVEDVRAEERCSILDTLGWAYFALGLDAEALEASRQLYEAAPPHGRVVVQDFVFRLVQAVEFARGPAGDEPLLQARARLAQLEHEVFGFTLPHFEREDDRWWHRELAELVSAIGDLADPERGLVSGFSPRYGWGMERRIAFARSIEDRSLSGTEARARWSAALEAIGRSPLYEGLVLTPQLGLVPLGEDPDSGLQEFADLATGEPPRRSEDGRLQIGAESSVVFVLLPGGTFELGAQSGSPSSTCYDPQADPAEGPVHRVTLAPFFLAKHEFTQGQWRRVAGYNPSMHLDGTWEAGQAQDERSPVERMSWLEAQRQLARLGWTLPTEAQWEYAARGGTDFPWWPGEEVLALDGQENLSDSFARANDAHWAFFDEELEDGWLNHAPVGSFEANPFGLYDMLGNVCEWCLDPHGAYSLPVGAGTGLRRGGNPATRVIRGGSFFTVAKSARVSVRNSGSPEMENETIGVRPCRAVDR